MSTNVPPEALVLYAARPGRDPIALWQAAAPVDHAWAGRTWRTLERLQAYLHADFHPDYPPSLRDLESPPRVVFRQGAELPDRERAVAIVGSRAASRYGVDQARRLAGDLARVGFVVVSGLARGIDAAAHRGALEVGGSTVAVLPGGLDCVTPTHHRELAEEIRERGSVISEWPSGPPSVRGMFVRRNRLIAALARATVVVEAALTSGALTTAAAARRLGRPVLAVPGDIDRETARGCHALIRSGAHLCEAAGDVLALCGEAANRKRSTGAADSRRAPSGPSPAPSAARVLEALGAEPRTLEEIASAARLPVPEVLAGLLSLEWAGAAAALAGQRWMLRGRGPG